MRKTWPALLLFVASLSVFLAFSTSAHATLIVNGVDSNGYQLIYDTGPNITWYDYSEQFSEAGWNAAVSWAAALNVGGTTGWRLPHVLPVNGSTYNYNWSSNGSTDLGQNISAPSSAYPGSTGSEMAYLFAVDLGNLSNVDTNGNPQPDYGLVNTGPFKNLLPDGYWSGTYAPAPLSGTFTYAFQVGQQTMSNTNSWGAYAMAVHDGDVLADGEVLPDGPPTPIPGAILLFVPGLVGLAAIRRRFKK